MRNIEESITMEESLIFLSVFWGKKKKRIKRDKEQRCLKSLL